MAEPRAGLPKGDEQVRVLIQNIDWHPQSPWQNGKYLGTRRSGSSSTPLPLIVRPNPQKPGRLFFVAGIERFLAAKEVGEPVVECTVEADITQERIGLLQLGEAYSRGLFPAQALKMAETLIRYRQQYDVTQQELSRRMEALGIRFTPGSIHHYESLLKLPLSLKEALKEGSLTFKEGRSIADIPSFERQEEVATLFTSGRLSSAYVERVVALARKDPDLGAEALLSRALNPGGEGSETKEGPEADENNPGEQTPPLDLNGLTKSVLNLAGELAALSLQTMSEQKRRPLFSALRILAAKLEEAIRVCGQSP